MLTARCLALFALLHTASFVVVCGTRYTRKMAPMSRESVLGQDDNDLLRDANNPLDRYSDGLTSQSPAKTTALMMNGTETTKRGDDTAVGDEPVSIANGDGSGEENSGEPGMDHRADKNQTEEGANQTNTTSETNQTNATSNQTAQAKMANADCVTRDESRAKAWFAETSPPGTPCVFGADVRDEGSHCILDAEGTYGTFGWCYTSADKSTWGSCGEGCPLSGHTKILGAKLDKLTGMVQDLKSYMENGGQNNNEGNGTNTANQTGSENTDAAANEVDADGKKDSTAKEKNADADKKDKTEGENNPAAAFTTTVRKNAVKRKARKDASKKREKAAALVQKRQNKKMQKTPKKQ